jgi:hypothetical protein
VHDIRSLSLPASWYLIITTVVRRMRDPHTPNSLELRRQPPTSMSTTSSQYYRSAGSHSHYPSFSANDHEQLYTLASWHQDPNHASYAGPPSAPFLHYSQAGASSVSHPSSAPQNWPAVYSRQGLQGWVQSVGDDVYAPRSSIPYDAAEGSAPVPHPNAEALRQYQQQQTLNTNQDIALNPPDDAYRSTNGFHELRISSVGAQVYKPCCVLR